MIRALDALTRRLGPAVDAGWDQVGEETCPACEGEGSRLTLDHERTHPWHWEPSYSEFRCDSCCGTGRAPVVAFTIRPAAPLVDAPIPLGGDTDDHVPF